MPRSSIAAAIRSTPASPASRRSFASQHHGYTGDLGTLGLFYREYAALMDHWREVLPLPIYDLDYEQLVETPEA